MTVHWTEAALGDLRAIEVYLARHSGRYAQGIIGRIFDRSETLADHPRLGPVVPEFGDESLREVVRGPLPDR